MLFPEKVCRVNCETTIYDCPHLVYVRMYIYLKGGSRYSKRITEINSWETCVQVA